MIAAFARSARAGLRPVARQHVANTTRPGQVGQQRRPFFSFGLNSYVTGQWGERHGKEHRVNRYIFATLVVAPAIACLAEDFIPMWVLQNHKYDPIRL